MVSETTYMVVHAMAANQRDMVDAYETKLAELGEDGDKVAHMFLRLEKEHEKLKKEHAELWRAKAAESMSLYERINGLESTITELRAKLDKETKYRQKYGIESAVYRMASEARELMLEVLAVKHPELGLCNASDSGRTVMDNLFRTAFEATIRRNEVPEEQIRNAEAFAGLKVLPPTIPTEDTEQSAKPGP